MHGSQTEHIFIAFFLTLYKIFMPANPKYEFTFFFLYLFFICSETVKPHETSADGIKTYNFLQNVNSNTSIIIRHFPPCLDARIVILISLFTSTVGIFFVDFFPGFR